MAITRRKFLGMTAVTGASLMLPWRFGAQEAFAAQAVSPALAKWAAPLRGLGAGGIQVATAVPDPVFANTVMYDITLGEFTDILHPALPPTKLRGYWDTKNPATKSHLGGLIIAKRGEAARLRFTNALPAGLKSIIPNDPTVQNPVFGAPTTEDRTATHLHGGQVPWISDGGPFDFWDSAGAGGASFLNGPGSILDNIPGKPMTAGQADYFYPNNQSTRLMWYHDHAYGITRTNAYAGVATGYAMIDPAQEVTFGMTLPTNSKDPVTGAIKPFDNLAQFIPLVFQDKKFVNAATILAQDPTWSLVARPDVQTTGSLWYAHIYDPREFKLLNLIPPPNPSCIPEFFGDTMLCNGTVQPLVTVEAKRYRFWALNACNARFLNINLLEVAPGGEVLTDKTTLLPVLPKAGPAIVQIGTEGGYLQKEVIYNNLSFFNPITMTGNMLLGCAERSDFIIDFTGMAGREFIMYNDAPGPFPAGPPTTDYFIGNNKNPAMAGVLPGQTIDTRNILKIKVVAAATADQSLPFPGFPATLPREPFLAPYPNPIPAIGPIAPLAPPAGATVRNITLNEDFDTYGRLRQLIGGTTPVPVPGKKNVLAYGLEYNLPATETPVSNGVEVWNIYNLTADTHPMHFHLVDVQVLSRQAFTLTKGVFTLTPLTKTGPELSELGWKETVKINPGQMTSVCMKFTMPKVPFTVPFSTRGMGAAGAVIPQANEYVWHCHILEHEEHDMMRPLVVTGPNPQTPLATNPVALSVNGFTGAAASTVFINSNTGVPTVASNNLGVTATMLPVLNGNYRFDVSVAANTPGGATTVTVTDGAQTANLSVDIFGVTPGYTGAVAGITTMLLPVTLSYGISGGTGPYTIASDNAAYPAVPVIGAGGAVIGFTVTVNPNALFVGPVVVNYTVTDASVPAKAAVVTVTLTA